MLNNLPSDSCILYLWQNRHTVVIGKNQNAWSECKVEELERDGGFLARRLSGGGAVFHDLGNLNFTFIVPTEDYSVLRQLEVIAKAVDSYGLKSEISGRNDLTVDGRKFSGNAFCKKGGNAYHHGTLLICVDMENIGKYLNVSKEKLKSNGVSSVKSRVCNLQELSSKITVNSMKERLISSFKEVYNESEGDLKGLPMSFFDEKELLRLTEKYLSWEWRLGRNIPFDVELNTRSEHGNVTIRMSVKGGIIRQAEVFSDAMDVQAVAKIAPQLTDLKYDEEKITDIVNSTMAQASAAIY